MLKETADAPTTVLKKIGHNKVQTCGGPATCFGLFRPYSGRDIIASYYGAVVGIFTVTCLTAGYKDNYKFDTSQLQHLPIFIH